MPKKKLYSSFDEDRLKIEAECEKTKFDATCPELLRDVPPALLKPQRSEDPDNPYTDEFTRKEKNESLKKAFLKFVKPKKEEKKKDIFDICMSEPTCNLECLYGHKLDEEEEKPEPDTVKGLVYTKGGAVYETVAYRLPDDFGWEPVPGKEPVQPAYFEAKKKKQKKPEIMEFTGPVKIIVVDKESFFTSYEAKRILAAFIQLGYILIGCTIMCIYFYTLKYNFHYSTNVHILSCLVAFQYCLPAALLLKDKSSISGYVLSSKHQFRDSLLLKTFAMFNIYIGVKLLHAWRLHIHGGLYTAHAIPGYAACAFAVVEYILHVVLCVLLGHDKGHLVDCYLHILTEAAIYSSLKSFYLGIILHHSLVSFFAYSHWHYWVLASAVIFAVVAVFSHCMECLFHLWGYICKFAMCVFHIFRPHDPCTPRGDLSDLQRQFNPYAKQTV